MSLQMLGTPCLWSIRSVFWECHTHAGCGDIPFFWLFKLLCDFLSRNQLLFLGFLLSDRKEVHMRTSCSIPEIRQVPVTEWELPAGSSVLSSWLGLCCGHGIWSPQAWACLRWLSCGSLSPWCAMVSWSGSVWVVSQTCFGGHVTLLVGTCPAQHKLPALDATVWEMVTRV